MESPADWATDSNCVGTLSPVSCSYWRVSVLVLSGIRHVLVRVAAIIIIRYPEIKNETSER